MGHPELNSDESVLLATQNIVVKSVPFEAILTNERLILVNSRDTLMPPQYLPLAAILSMDTGENAIRDPTITFSVGTETGSTRQMVLTFSRQSGGERKRECDEWAKVLHERLVEFVHKPSYAQAPRNEDDLVPLSPPDLPQPATGGTQTGKKRIEVARPMKKIIETVPAPQKPKETISLPQGSFCSRCGSRVPPDSAFCNRCGTRVASPAGQAPAPGPVTPPESVEQVAVPVPNVVTPTQGRERPIEDVIHSIEPLIEDSRPRTQPAPLVPSRHTSQAPPATIPEKTPPAPVADIDPMKKNLDLFSNILVSSEPVVAADAPPASGGAGTTPPAAATPWAPPAPGSDLSFPPPEKRSSSGKTRMVTYGVIAVIVIAAILGGFLLMKNGGTVPPVVTPTPTIAPTPIQTSVVPTATPTPAPTVATPTPMPTPVKLFIPQTGVWVHVKYAGSFTGSYGTAGNEQQVTDTGDHVYQIPTLNGIVVATFTKNDGSADPILVEVYRNGVVAASNTITTPSGVDEIQVNLKPEATVTQLTTTQPTVLPISQHINSTG